MKIITYIILLLALLLTGCEAPQDLNRPGDKMDGYVFYVDTLFITAGGYYSISLYSADSSSPFQRVPVRTDSLNNIYLHGYNYESQYSMDGIQPGRYYVASTWSRYPKIPNEIPKVLGTYGCDTSYTCSSHKIVAYPNTQGNFRSIWSWTDTTKAIY
jgi:hypothetical protein